MICTGYRSTAMATEDKNIEIHLAKDGNEQHHHRERKVSKSESMFYNIKDSSDYEYCQW